MKTQVEISPEIKEKCPELRLGCIECRVEVGASGEDLKSRMAQACARIKAELAVEAINDRPAIRATREAYKVLGKEPSRYRPSAESLTRRVVKGKGLYHVNNVVDLLNLVSLNSGYSIGGWDADRINGTAVLGIGREGEPYEAIGRGQLNIAFFPTFRDEESAFGTPTSDSERTKVRDETSAFLMIIYAFDGESENLREAIDLAMELLEAHASASEISTQII